MSEPTTFLGLRPRASAPQPPPAPEGPRPRLTNYALRIQMEIGMFYYPGIRDLYDPKKPRPPVKVYPLPR